MSDATTNGTVEATKPAGTNRLKNKGKAGTKQGRLYALAQKAAGKTGTLRRKFEDGETYSFKFSGFPTGLSATGVEDTADSGGTVGVKAPVGAASLALRGQMGGDDATELVKEMIED